MLERETEEEAMPIWEKRGVETGLYRKYRGQVTGRKVLRLPLIHTDGVLIGGLFFLIYYSFLSFLVNNYYLHVQKYPWLKVLFTWFWNADCLCDNQGGDLLISMKGSIGILIVRIMLLCPFGLGVIGIDRFYVLQVIINRSITWRFSSPFIPLFHFFLFFFFWPLRGHYTPAIYSHHHM